MRSKLDWASAAALAATVVTVLFGAQGSGAAAADLVPILIDQPAKTPPPAPAAPAPAPQFAAHPVVQTVSAEDTAADTLAERVSEQKTPGSLSGQMRCLATAIYFEARGETLDGQLAVGRVIVNRTKSGRFPASYCGVVYQPQQFSFIHGRALPSVETGSGDWRKAVAIAEIAVEGSWKSRAQGALYFHAASVSPNWRLTKVAQVDNHVFYL